MKHWITVIDVMRRMKVEPSSHFSWMVGDIVRIKWELAYGELPSKQLRNKTNAGGSHCFAIYPPEWEKIIAGVILACQPKPETQMTFDFLDDP